MIKLEKRKGVYSIILIFVVIVAISVMISSSNQEAAETISDYDSSYYVEANNNVFVKLAKVCDDCCYYVVDMVLGGIESIFSSMTGS